MSRQAVADEMGIAHSYTVRGCTMDRITLAIVIFAGLISVSAGQETALQRSPKISLVLPSDIAPETVQINYFTEGSSERNGTA
jgi:hypothetical protein